MGGVALLDDLEFPMGLDRGVTGLTAIFANACPTVQGRDSEHP
jgi:hypothetical protein